MSLENAWLTCEGWGRASGGAVGFAVVPKADKVWPSGGDQVKWFFSGVTWRVKIMSSYHFTFQNSCASWGWFHQLWPTVGSRQRRKKKKREKKRQRRETLLLGFLMKESPIIHSTMELRSRAQRLISFFVVQGAMKFEIPSFLLVAPDKWVFLS